MQKVVIRCAGCSDGDAQQLHCFFTSFISLLFSSLQNLTSNVFLLFCSLECLSLDCHCSMFLLISLKLLALRLALPHILS
jgi:hypothetical protein